MSLSRSKACLSNDLRLARDGDGGAHARAAVFELARCPRRRVRAVRHEPNGDGIVASVNGLRIDDGCGTRGEGEKQDGEAHGADRKHRLDAVDESLGTGSRAT